MKTLLLILGFILSPALSALEITTGDYQGRADVASFVQRVAAESAYSEQELADLFGRVEKQEHLFAKLDRPAEKELEWYAACIALEEHFDYYFYQGMVQFLKLDPTSAKQSFLKAESLAYTEEQQEMIEQVMGFINTQ